MITNIDIVKEQIKIAANEKLIISQPSINFSGHAIECRINAQHPDNNFAPSPGFIDYLFLPSGCLGLRVDSFIYAGYTVPPFYDSMLAKIVTHGSNREDAIIKKKRALAELIISGVETNIDFLISILNHENYLSNNFGTSFLKKEFIL